MDLTASEIELAISNLTKASNAWIKQTSQWDPDVSYLNAGASGHIKRLKEDIEVLRNMLAEVNAKGGN